MLLPVWAMRGTPTHSSRPTFKDFFKIFPTIKDFDLLYELRTWVFYEKVQRFFVSKKNLPHCKDLM